jgi:Nif-specific regulatory protein
LFESELFGYDKGAFTGANVDKIGHFELADGGTLFLDEIGEIPISVQAKLLRVIQEKTFTKVGGLKSITVDVRIVAATNIDLEQAVKDGKFRADLYFRLNVIPIHIAPLRKRKIDIPILIEHFLEKFNKENDKKFKSISSSGIKKMLEYKWPGNVRELMNIIERIIVLNDGKIIETNMIPEVLEDRVNMIDSGLLDEESTLQEIEAFYIERTLKFVEWNLSKCAKILQIDRKTLYSKIEKYNIKKEEI